MAGLSGSNAAGAVAGVQARIARIEQIAARFGGGPAALGSGGGDFARSLESAKGTSPFGGAWPVDALPTELSDIAAKNPDKSAWAIDLLGRLGLPKTRENLRAVVAWQTAEGSTADFNPLATTRESPGATNFNSVGVKNYTSYESGMQETVETLHNGLYEGILAALARGNDAKAVATAIGQSKWGTGGLVHKVLEGTI